MSYAGFSPLSTWPLNAVPPWRGAVNSPLAGLLADPSSNRTWLLTATPIDPATSTETTIRVGTQGYWDWVPGESSSDTWPAALMEPYNYRLDVLPGGRAASGPLPILGDWVVANPNGDFDHWTGLSWRGAEVTIRLGDASAQAMIEQEQGTGLGFERFAPVLVGRVQGIHGDASTIRLRARWSLDPLEQTRFQETIYRGWGGSIRAPARVVYPSPQTPVPGDQWTARVRVLVDGSTGRLFGDQASPSSGAGWLIRLNSSQQVEAELKDGTNTTTLTSQALADGWHEIALEVDQLTDEDATLYVGETVEDTASLASWAAIPSGNPAVGEAPGTGDGLDAGEIAQAEIWQGLRGAGTGVVYDGTEPGLLFLDDFSERSGVVSGQTAKWTSDGLSFDGVDDAEEVGLSTQLYDVGGAWSIEILYQDNSASDNRYLWSEGNSSGTGEFVGLQSVSGGLRLLTKDSGGTFRASGTVSGTQDGRVKHLVFVDNAGVYTFYIDGEAVLSGTYNQPGSLSVDRNAFGALALVGLGSFFAAHVYGARMWRRALTSTEVSTLKWNSSIDGVDQDGLEVNLLHDEGTGNPVDTANGHTVTLTGATWVSTAGDVQAGTWSSTFEGEEDVRGKTKPRAIGGILTGIEPVLVDPQFLIWQLAEGVLESVEVLRDGATELTSLGDTTDLIGASPAPGLTEYYTDLSRGLLLTGAEPDGNLTAEIKGEKKNGTYTAERWTLIQSCAAEAGVTDVDAVSVAAAQAADVAGPCGLYSGLGDLRTIASVVRSLAAPDGWVTSTRTGQLTVALLPDPATVVPVHVITADDLLDGAAGLQLEAVYDPAHRIILAWGRNYTPQKLSDLGGQAVALGLYSLTQPWQEEPDTDDDVLQDFPQAQSERYETTITTRSGALAMLARLRTLYGAARAVYRLNLPEGLFQYQPPDGFDASVGRYELVNNVTAVCVGFDETHRSTAARVWL